MTDEQHNSPLRLRRKHGEGRQVDATAADGAALVRAQSLRNALVAGLIVFVVFCMAWILVSSAFGKVFPWFTVVLGGLLGTAIRITGRGLDWRFPVLAAGLAVLGSLAANIVLAASTTAADFGTDTLTVLQRVTSMTWPVYFDEVWGAADSFFAVVAAGIAAFFAPRRLTRRQRFALRLWREEQGRD